MKIVVTGFVGSHVVDQLVTAGHDVTVVDDLDPSAHDGAPAGLSPAAEYRRADLRRPDSWLDVLDGVDAVCRQAAKVGLGVDFADVGEYVSRNVVATAQLLSALHDRAFGGRIVLASSMVVYGEGRYRCERHGVVRPGARGVVDLDAGRFEPPWPDCGCGLVAEAVPEDHWLDPRNVYATTKLAQESLAASYAREHPGSTVTALRYHNVCGPRMPRDTPYAGVASICRSAYARGVARAIGSGLGPSGARGPGAGRPRRPRRSVRSTGGHRSVALTARALAGARSATFTSGVGFARRGGIRRLRH